MELESSREKYIFQDLRTHLCQFYALLLWGKYDHERPDYETYVKRMKKREKIDKKLAKEENKNKIIIEPLKPHK